jgi:hypothetical protein
VKSAEEIMNILEAFDLTGSLRDAAELAGCSHHTVAPGYGARDPPYLHPPVTTRVRFRGFTVMVTVVWGWLSLLPVPDSCRVLRAGGRGQGARSARVANTASLNLAASCQPVPVTFSSRTSWCPLNVAELL